MANNIEMLGRKLMQGFGKSSEILGRKIDQAGLNYLLLETKSEKPK